MRLLVPFWLGLDLPIAHRLQRGTFTITCWIFRQLSLIYYFTCFVPRACLLNVCPFWFHSAVGQRLYLSLLSVCFSRVLLSISLKAFVVCASVHVCVAVDLLCWRGQLTSTQRQSKERKRENVSLAHVFQPPSKHAEPPSFPFLFFSLCFCFPFSSVCVCVFCLSALRVPLSMMPASFFCIVVKGHHLLTHVSISLPLLTVFSLDIIALIPFLNSLVPAFSFILLTSP